MQLQEYLTSLSAADNEETQPKERSRKISETKEYSQRKLQLLRREDGNISLLLQNFRLDLTGGKILLEMFHTGLHVLHIH